MTVKDINNIISIICPNDEDFEKPIISPKYLKEELEQLALEQEPKTGRWIFEIWNNREHYFCSECNRVVNYEPFYRYCPFCGAKMESEE